MYCTYCGSQNTDDANFCFNCGKELSRSPTEEVVESVTDEPQSKVQAHHPWMSEQPQPQEQVHEKSQEETKEQGEVPQALKSIQSRLSGWSTKKKIIWG